MSKFQSGEAQSNWHKAFQPASFEESAVGNRPSQQPPSSSRPKTSPVPLNEFGDVLSTARAQKIQEDALQRMEQAQRETQKKH